MLAVGIGDTVLASLHAPTQQSVLNALSDPAVGAIRFTAGKVALTPRHFARVKRRVESGAIRVVYQPHLRSPLTLLPQCRYDPAGRTLALGFCYAETVSALALVIHEATHAGWDADPQGAPTALAAETVAFLARGIFLSVKMAAPARANLLLRGGLSADPVLVVALRVADRVLAGKPIQEGDLADLRRSLLGHPEHALRLLAPIGSRGISVQPRRRHHAPGSS
jgi:hypothetical protein